MSDEQIKVEEKECNCICCKILKSDCLKKFLTVVLASFIGCSLALLVFAPKKPPRPCCLKPPTEHRFNKPLPPMMYDYGMRPEFRGERPKFKHCNRYNKNFNRRGPHRVDFKGGPQFQPRLERPIPPVQPGPYKKPVQPVQPVIPE